MENVIENVYRNIHRREKLKRSKNNFRDLLCGEEINKIFDAQKNKGDVSCKG